MGNIVVDNTIEFLKDESTGELVGYKRKDGTERGIATTVTDPLTGGIRGIVGTDGLPMEFKRSKINTLLGQKLFGLSSVSAQSTAYTYYAKVAAPADFDAVRVILYHHIASTPNMVAAVSVTETSKTDTADNMFECIVGGTKYQTLDSTADQYGFRSVKWNSGASSITVATGTATVPSVNVSDWVSLSSVPRAAGEGSTLPLVMLRLFSTDAATQNTSTTSVNAAGRTESTANGGNIIQSGAFLGNGVATISDANRPGSLATSAIVFGLQFRCRRSGLLVMAGGDSITQNNALVADIVSAWGLRGCAALNYSGLPVSFWNNGQSSQASSIFQPNLLAHAPTVRPNVIVYSAYSPNDYTSPTAGQMRYALQNMIGRTREVIDYARQNRIALILTTGLPHFAGLGAAQDTLRKAYNDSLRSQAASGEFILCDFDASLSDGGSPANISATYSFGDNIHPNEAGVAVMGALFADALRKVVTA